MLKLVFSNTLISRLTIRTTMITFDIFFFGVRLGLEFFIGLCRRLSLFWVRIWFPLMSFFFFLCIMANCLAISVDYGTSVAAGLHSRICANLGFNSGFDVDNSLQRISVSGCFLSSIFSRNFELVIPSKK